jgi:hypothetical protein
MSGMNDLHPRRGLFSFLLGKEGYGTTQEDEEKKRKLFFHVEARIINLAAGHLVVDFSFSVDPMDRRPGSPTRASRGGVGDPVLISANPSDQRHQW